MFFFSVLWFSLGLLIPVQNFVKFNSSSITEFFSENFCHRTCNTEQIKPSSPSLYVVSVHLKDPKRRGKIQKKNKSPSLVLEFPFGVFLYIPTKIFLTHLQFEQTSETCFYLTDEQTYIPKRSPADSTSRPTD